MIIKTKNHPGRWGGKITASLNDKEVGKIDYHTDNNDKIINIKDLKVDEQYRRQGIATKLLKKLKRSYPLYSIMVSCVGGTRTKESDEIMTQDELIAFYNKYGVNTPTYH